MEPTIRRTVQHLDRFRSTISPPCVDPYMNFNNDSSSTVLYFVMSVVVFLSVSIVNFLVVVIRESQEDLLGLTTWNFGVHNFLLSKRVFPSLM